jgi:hypothetical protein
MRREDIRELLKAWPFRPFRLRTTNNLVYEIRHPELVILAGSVVHIAIAPAQSVAGEREVGLALLHIVQYEF